MARFTKDGNRIARRGVVPDADLAAFQEAGFDDGAALAMLCNFANNLGPAGAEPGTLRLGMAPGSACAMTRALPQDLTKWLVARADSIDAGDVPAILGGSGDTVMDGVQAIAAVAQESLAAAFMLWGHRCSADFMVQIPNHALRNRLLPDFLTGRVVGASGLSNVMKFLAGIEPSQMTARSSSPCNAA